MNKFFDLYTVTHKDVERMNDVITVLDKVSLPTFSVQRKKNLRTGDDTLEVDPFYEDDDILEWMDNNNYPDDSQYCVYVLEWNDHLYLIQYTPYLDSTMCIRLNEDEVTLDDDLEVHKMDNVTLYFGFDHPLPQFN